MANSAYESLTEKNRTGRTCLACNQFKSADQFYLKKTRHGKLRLQTYCKTCDNDRRRKNYRKRGIELTWEERFGFKYGDRWCAACKCNIWGHGRSRFCKSCKDKFRIESLKRIRLPILGVYFYCLECGTNGLANGSRGRRFCSKACGWTHNRRNRRARNRAAFVEQVNLFEIAERDKWICQLCGKKVSRKASFNKQATIDHVIPISKGGKHEAANCQLAHFDCNSVKHDKITTLF